MEVASWMCSELDTTTHTASGGDVPNEDVACGGEVVEVAEEIG